MPEIMSAEELCLKVQGYNHDSAECHMPSSQEAIKTIRSRDSAMLDKYKEAIRKAVTARINGGDFLGKDNICIILDSAFAEIEGGK